MKQTVSVHGILSSISTSQDRTLKLVFRTQELPSEEAGILHGLAHAEGWCVFSGAPIKAEDVPTDEPKSLDKGKTPSQRLRATLFVLWRQKGKQGDFDTYYAQALERVIGSVKAQLEPTERL